MRFNALVSMIFIIAVVSGAVFAADGRIPIYQPTALTNAGSYYLTEDITGNIQVDVNDITLDLNGHTVTGNIQVDSTMMGVYNIRITNGRINGNLDASNGGIEFVFDNLELFGSLIYQFGMQFSIHDCIAQNIDITSGMNGKVYNCTVQSAPADAIMMMGCMSVQATYNTIMDNWGGNGINASQCWACDISNNDISSNGSSGIFLGMANNNKVSFNNSSGNMTDGITLNGGSSFNTLSNNTVSGNSTNGISVLNASADNSFDWNVISGNGTDGIMFDATTMGNTYGNNRALGNSGVPYNDLGTNIQVCYDGPACLAPTNY